MQALLEAFRKGDRTEMEAVRCWLIGGVGRRVLCSRWCMDEPPSIQPTHPSQTHTCHAP